MSKLKSALSWVFWLLVRVIAFPFRLLVQFSWKIRMAWSYNKANIQKSIRAFFVVWILILALIVCFFLAGALIGLLVAGYHIALGLFGV